MDELEERVRKFNSLSLPGQPMGMHLGTSYLVNDLWREVQRLRGLTPRALDEASWDCSNCENRQIGACFEACPNCDTPRQ